MLSGIYDNNGTRLVKDKNAVLGGSRAVPVVATDGFTVYPDLDRSTFGRGLFMTFSGLSRAAALRNNRVGQQLNAAFKTKYGHFPRSAYPFYSVAAMQVIRAAIAASDGTRTDVTHAVFSGAGIKIAKDKSALGRGFTISTATGGATFSRFWSVRARPTGHDRGKGARWLSSGKLITFASTDSKAVEAGPLGEPD